MKEKVNMLSEDTETIWNYSKYHIGPWIEVYSTDKIIMKRYESFTHKFPDHCKLVSEDQYSMTFSIDPKCMGFYPKAPRQGPKLSEEQRQANVARLESFRKAKQNKAKR